MTENNKPDTLMVFSGKGLNTMIKAGGCGDWKLDQDRARRRRYLVAVRNQHAPWSEMDVPHCVAWLVATVRDVVEASDGRWCVRLDQYALINKPFPWGSRNPVAYTRLDELEIEPGGLQWKAFPEPPEADGFGAVQPEAAPSGSAATHVQPLTFEQAKKGLAAAMGIRPEQIEITIRA